MIFYGKQNISTQDIDAVIKVLKGPLITQGDLIEKFENNLKSFFKSKHCTVVSNGTAALHIAARSLKWKKDDIIITSPLNFVASANSILSVGATPLFVDIEENFYNIDPNKIEYKIKKLGTKKIKAIIAVDYAGHPCDWDSLRYLSNKYNLKLINDNCHALGAEYKKNIGYAVKKSDIVIQSYHPVKNITTGEGGALLTNNIELDKLFKYYRNHSIIKENNFDTWYYKIKEPGMNYRITDFQCALGISQLKKLKKFVMIRNLLAKNYDKNFKNIDFMKCPTINSDAKHAFHLYPLQINFDKIKKNKNIFFRKLLQKNIKLQVHYIPLHQQPLFKKFVKSYSKNELRISEKFYQNEVSLPIYPSLGIKNQQKVISQILKNV